MIKIKKEKILSKKDIKSIISMGISLKDSIDQVEQKCVQHYDTTRSYAPKTLTIYDNYIWECKYSTMGEFDENKWIKLCDYLTFLDKNDVEAMIGLTPDEIDTLSKIILDNSIELSSTWSSSKIYSEIKSAINEGKQFTLSKLANTMTASFKIATSTTDMTENNILYLLSTGTNTYDIYALIDGVPNVIASTTIDLSSYAKLTDLDNYYTKNDSDGKFATIITVDEKFDKTNINTSISNSPSDEKVLSEKAVKSELDNKASIKNIKEVEGSVVGKKKYLVMDLPSENSESGKTTRMFFTDSEVNQIEMQVLGEDGIEKDIKFGAIDDIKSSSATTWSSEKINTIVGNLKIDYTYRNSDSMNVKLVHFGAYKFGSPTKGVPSNNVGDWVLINIPWQTDANNLSSMQFANQLLFSPRRNNTFWFRSVWNYNEDSYVYTEGDYSVFNKWRIINTSTVDDISPTTSGVSLINNSSATGSVTYSIKNGYANVSINGIKFTSGTSCEISGLPIPSQYIYSHIGYAGNVVGEIYANANDSTIKVVMPTTGNAGYGFISYPIVE